MNRMLLTLMLVLAIPASEWQSSGILADIEPLGGDMIVNFKDFAALALNWVEGI